MLRPWELQITINRGSDIAIHLQLVQHITEEIQRGRLPPKAVLPGSRELSEKLGVNRKTVILAYEELIAQGWLVTQGKRGTFVSPSIPAVPAPRAKPADHRDRAKPVVTTAPAPSCQEADATNRFLLQWSDGVPDTRLIPFEVLSRAFRHALIASSRANRLGYDDPRGSMQLRRAIATMLNNERGLDCDIQNVCLVRGSQMGIYLSAKLLIRPGDKVVMEHLSYPPACAAFRSCGGEVLTVGMDANGMDMDALEEMCKKHTIRAVYVTPHHQFPTTVMMTADRRMRLLILASQYDFVILEDDYDHEFHFSHHPVLPLTSMDRSGRVIYVGSMSKVLAPGLRVGYLVASEEIINQGASEIMHIDRQGNAVTELAVAELLDSGEIKRHIRRTLKVYSERREAIASIVVNALDPYVECDIPDGGLAFWLRMKSQINLSALMAEAKKLQIGLLSGSMFSIDGAPVNAIRLGYANFNPSELTVGLNRLKGALSQSVCC